MLLQFVALDDQLPSEDTIGHSYLIYGMLKCIAVLRMVRVCMYIIVLRMLRWLMCEYCCMLPSCFECVSVTVCVISCIECVSVTVCVMPHHIAWR